MKVLPQNITKGLGGWEKPTNILYRIGKPQIKSMNVMKGWIKI